MKQENVVGFDHLNLTVQNLDETKAWYENILGFTEVESGIDGIKRWSIIRNQGSMLCLHEDENRELIRDDSLYQINHFGIQIKNRKELEAIIKKYNLTTYYGSPVYYPKSTSWYVKDPTGYTIELSIWNDDTIQF